MVHFVMFKINDKDKIEEVVSQMRAVYKVIKDNYDCVKDYQIETNCVERDSNMDIMIRVELENQAALTTYLECDEHVDLIDINKKYFEGKVSFDYM